MGKQLWIEDDQQFGNNHPGCMSGILHALDYQYWHSNVKKLLPHRKQDELRRAKRKRSPKIRLKEHDSCEVQKLLDAETSHFLVDRSSRKTGSTSKRFLKARIKALLSEEISKEDNQKQQFPGFPARSRLQRTYSIHHLEPSDLGHGKVSNDSGHPIIFLHNNADTGASRLKDHNQLAENNTLPQEKCEKVIETSVSQKDIFEIFKVNKELFLTILQNTDGQQASDTKDRLTKSGSYPAAYLSHGKNSRPSELKHKQVELYCLPRGEKVTNTRAPKLVSSKSGPLMIDHSRVQNQETGFSSLGSMHELDKHGRNSLAVPLNDMKQRMEHAGSNESNCHETNGFAYDLNKGTFTHIRRTSSLSESVDRYAQLFEYSSSREAKLHLSRSLKMTNEYEIPSSSHAPMFFRRIHSLPHLDNYGSIRNQECHDAHFPEMPTRNVVDSSKNIESDGHDETSPVALSGSTEKYIGLESKEGTECLNMVETSDISPRGECTACSTVCFTDVETAKMGGLDEEITGFTVGKSNYEKEQEISTEIASSLLPQPSPVLVPECCFQEVVKNHAEFEISEGSDYRCNYFDENESPVNSLNISDGDFVSRSDGTMCPEKFENAKESVKSHRHVKLYVEDDANFTYVRDILERSGFITNDFQETWYSSHQPLDPSVFHELESHYPHEPECFEDEVSALYHHMLLFDLVDEVMLEMYEKSFTCYPKALSSACHVRPAPVGYHVLEEVWGNISRSLSLKPEMKQSLDFVVSQDLGKDDGWMNLQLESECVALELEDLIFDELLEEVFCS